MSELVFKGDTFTLAEKIGLMPLMKFAVVARRGVDSNELDGLAAMYDLLEQVISDGDWDRFQDHASKTRADGDELMGVVTDAIAAISARPTGQPSDSSAGLSSTSVKSAAVSSSPVIARLEEQGRPDLALMVDMASRRSA